MISLRSALHGWLGLAVAGTLTLSAQEEEFAIDPTPPERPDGKADMLAKVRPAIVSVFPARLLQAGEIAVLERFFGAPPGEGDDEEDGEADPEDNIQGVGSGVLVTRNGLVVTNSHVVHLSTGKLADAVYVELIDKRRFPAEVVGVDPLTDLALLRIEGDEFPYLTITDSDQVRVGDSVFAVGSPFKIGDTTTAGIVSALKRGGMNLLGPNGYESFIQTDASINPGNSGGGLVDRQGRLIGINTAIYHGGAGGNIGIGFAIPSNLMRHVVGRLLKDGEVRRGFLGIKVESVDAQIAKDAKLEEIAGVRIVDVLAGGPAAEAGLKKGDVLRSINDQPIADRGAFRLAISMSKPGDEILLKGFRGTHRVTARPRLSKPSETGAKGAEFEIPELPGVRVQVVAGEGLAGLRITKVKASSPLAAKLKPDTVISEINGKPVGSFAEASSALKKGVNKIVTRTGERTATVAIRID